MANWGKILNRGHVEDRRSFAPAAIGGVSLTGLALLFLFNIVSGGNTEDLLYQIQNIQVEEQSVNSEEYQGEDSYEVFASTVLGSNNYMWANLFEKSGQTYNEPKLVLFRSATQSECGLSTSEVGPHYCPLDKTIYLDETFFDELTSRFGARGGDVAESYVIAHEVAHHAQNELGIMDKVLNEKNDSERSRELSINLELQADCFAGLWAHSIKNEGIFEANEIIEAMDAAASVGDDRIQKTVTGTVNPETWTHGSSDARVNWFNKGYETGNFSSCDTF